MSFDLDLSKYNLGWSDTDVEYAFAPAKGLNNGVVDQISWWKGEPAWMSKFRQRSLQLFERKPMAPWFAVNMPDIDFQDIYYYLKPATEQVDEWDDLPEQMKATYEKLGIPEAERKYLAGVTAQYESEVVFHRNREDLEQQGILFCDMDTALREYPDVVKQYFGTVIPPGDNKFAALNSAVWSGGSFIYVPPGVECEMPLQAYFRINSENAGQFERTLIIADEGAKVHYIEGCSAPVYTNDSLHSAVVEIVVKPHARVTYTTIQNWSPNVYNLVTKRARVEEAGHMEWIDGNIGCLAEGATVTTPSGVKPIELVLPGDEVLSFDEGSGELVFRRVTAKRFSGVQPVRTVTVGSRSLTVTDNHPFLSYVDDAAAPAAQAARRLGYVRADHLEVALVPRTSIDYGHPFKLEGPLGTTEATTDDLMRRFGRCLGDGTPEVHPEPPEALGDLFGSNGLHAEAVTTRIPAWVYDTPESQRLEFVAGLLDRAGTALTGCPGLSFTSASTELVADLARLLDTLGVLGQRADAQRIEFPADPRLVARLSPALQGRVAEPPGRSSQTRPDTLEARPVSVSDHIGHRRTWDIEVEGTANFVSQGFVVHNSKLTMKYPSVYLVGPKATGEVLSVAYAGPGQHQDAGAKMVHAAPETTSKIVSKSISKDGGITTYRGLVRVDEGATGCKSHVQCDALILDEHSESRTLPYMEVGERDAQIGHEATVSKIADEQLFYLMSRGLSQEQAMGMVVNGFIEPITRTLPMEYAVEWSRLIELQMEGSVG